MNANKGYIGWSESVRSAQAKSNGEFPKTLFKKEYKLSEKKFHELLKSGFIIKSSWHHTSKFFNETDFYSFTNDGLFFLDIINFDEYASLEFQQNQPPKITFNFEYKLSTRKRIDCFELDGYIYDIIKIQEIRGIDLWTGKKIENGFLKIRNIIGEFITKTGKKGQIIQEILTIP